MDPELDVGTEGTQTTPETTTPDREYTAMEIKAIEQGWIPKEDFDGEADSFIDAPEFVRRGELFGKIEKQSKELKAVRQALDAFRQHHSKVKEMEYERALKTLKEAKRDATINGEHERALALDDKIDEVRAEKDAITQEVRRTEVQEPQGYTPEFQRWVNSNSWYEDNRVMRKAADALGIELHQEGYSPPEVLQMVEKEIKKEFAHKFVNPATKRPNAVEPSTRQPASRDTTSMTAEESEIMRKIVATGAMTEAEYRKEIKALKGR
jgi:hypothetical protein